MLWLLGVSVLLASLNSVFLHKIRFKKNESIYRFNLLCALVWCAVLAAVNGFRIHITQNVLVFGIVYGVAQVLFILFKTAAMNSGPVSVTTLIENSSLVISVLACLLLWGEPISIADVAGLALLLVGIVLCTYKKSEQVFSKRWKMYVVGFLVFAASVGVIFKAFSKAGGAVDAGSMLLVASIVMVVTYAVICFVSGGFRVESRTGDKRGVLAFVAYALVSGVCSCGYNRLNVYLSGALDGIVFFPVFNGGVILLSAILAMILLREKLRYKQMLGILSGILGICVIGIL